MAHIHYYLTQQTIESCVMLHANLLYSGTVRDDPHWFNVPHKHEFCEVLFINHGSGRIVIGGVEYPLHEGDLVILNPGIVHEESSDPLNPLHFVFIAIDNFQIGSMEANFLLAPGGCPIINSQKYRNKIESLFADILQETSSMVSFYAEMSIYQVNVLLLTITRLLLVGGDEQLTLECRKVKEYIDHNYTAQITLDELSESVYISKHHLAHSFKQQVGTSPIRYLINRRMKEASHLLVQTDDSVAQIAAQVGYNDPVYFSQIFKRTIGVSPQVYRKNNTK